MTPGPDKISFTLPDSCHGKIRALYDYWRSITPDRGIPGRRHFDPSAIPDLLPNIWLVDIVQTPLRFTYRLIGTEIVRSHGHDYTGCDLGLIFSDFENSQAYGGLQDILATKQPSWYHGTPGIRRHIDYFELERIFLPMATDGARIDLALALTVYHMEPSIT